MRIRAACHIHSDWSYDGKWSLAEIAAGFCRRNFRVALITEHDQGFDESRRLAHREACQAVSDDNILLIPGIEYSDAANDLHFLVWGNLPFLGSGLTADEIVERAHAAGGLIVLAHPSRRNAWKLFNPAWRDKLLGIELWNRKTDGWAPSHPGRKLIQSNRARPFVGMDFHSPRQFFPLATNVTVDAVTEESVLESFRQGRIESSAFSLNVQSRFFGVQTVPFQLAEKVRRTAARFYRKLPVGTSAPVKAAEKKAAEGKA